MKVRERFDKGINLKPENIQGVGGEDLNKEGDLGVDTSDDRLKVRLEDETQEVITAKQIQSLENKTIDADVNTVSNLETDNFKSGVINSDISGSPTNSQIPTAAAVKTYVNQETSAIQADVDDLITLSGVPANSTDLGTFTGNIIPDNTTVKGALQSLDTAVTSHTTAIMEVSEEVQDLAVLSGVPLDSTDLGTFTGTTIPDNSTIKEALQALETEVELKADESDLTAHVSAPSGVHGVTGAVVGTTDTQTLTNKTIDGAIINNPARAGVKEDTKANLVAYAATANNGQIVFATDEKKMYQIVDNALDSIGGESGGGLDVFYTQNMENLDNTSNFATGNDADFMGGGTLQGTLAVEDVAPISGLKSLKYIQAAGSLNDYFASDIIEIDPKQQNNTSGMTLYFTYDGNDNDMKFVVWDVTNGVELSNQVSFVKKTSKATRYSLSFYVPSTCTQIRWGVQVLVENIGAELVVDDVEMSTNPFQARDLINTQSSYIDRSGTFSNSAVAGALTVNKGSGIYSYNSSTGEYTFLKKASIVATLSARVDGAAHAVPVIRVNGSDFSSDQTQNVVTAWASSSFAGVVEPGDVVTGYVYNNSSHQRLSLSATATTEHVLTPSDTFSTDTAPLTWAAPAQYNLSTLANAPVGTYITFQYAVNTNTRTQCTTRPTQTDADMNVNGIRIFTRAFNAASTADEPAAIAIQIGKGMKGTSLNLYKSAGKVVAGSLDLVTHSATQEGGIRCKDYNENTGILIVDAGVRNGTTTVALLSFSDITDQNNGYLVINAGKTLPLLAVPTPQVAYLKDVKPSGTDGGTFTAGAWQTRTLNTVEGDGSIVSLNANQFTLGPGKYEIEASAPGFSCGNHKIKLFNVDSSSDYSVGSSENASSTYGGGNRSFVNCNLIINVPTKFEIRHYCTVTRSDIGLGVPSNFGVNEIYTQVKISKVG